MLIALVSLFLILAGFVAMVLSFVSLVLLYVLFCKMYLAEINAEQDVADLPANDLPPHA